MFDKKKYGREYYLQHKDEHRRYYRKYRKKHRKMRTDILRKWRHRKGISVKFYLGISHTPEYLKIKREEYKYNLRNAGELTFQTIQQVYDENIIANGGVLRCIYCCKELTLREATLEHKQPLSREGTNERDNLAIACKPCNSSKGNKTVEKFENYLKKKEVLRNEE